MWTTCTACMHAPSCHAGACQQRVSEVMRLVHNQKSPWICTQTHPCDMAVVPPGSSSRPSPRLSNAMDRS